jgi:hypothetical protein
VTFLHHAVEHRQHARGIPGRQAGQQLRQRLQTDRPQHLQGIGVGDDVAAERSQALQQVSASRTEPSPARATRSRGGVGDLQMLLVADVAQVRHHLARRDPAEGEDLAAGHDGGEDLLHLGGGQHEHHAGGGSSITFRRRWRVPREHVGLVQDEDLGAVAGGPEAQDLLQLADVLDLGAGGGVELDDVQGPALPISTQGRTGCRVWAWALLAVEALREQARHRGLPRPAHAAKR